MPGRVRRRPWPSHSQEAEHATSSAPKPKTATHRRSRPSSQPCRPFGPKDPSSRNRRRQKEATPPRPHRKPHQRGAPRRRETRPTGHFRPAPQRCHRAARADGELDRMPAASRSIARSTAGRRCALCRAPRPPLPPPPFIGEAPGGIGPGPVAPPWYYRDRAFASGPYPGIGFPGPRAAGEGRRVAEQRLGGFALPDRGGALGEPADTAPIAGRDHVCGAIQEPPTIGTLAKVRYSAARVSSMPPVGQNATPETPAPMP